jgi:hypothetical protein
VRHGWSFPPFCAPPQNLDPAASNEEKEAALAVFEAVQASLTEVAVPPLGTPTPCFRPVRMEEDDYCVHAGDLYSWDLYIDDVIFDFPLNGVCEMCGEPKSDWCARTCGESCLWRWRSKNREKNEISYAPEWWVGKPSLQARKMRRIAP